MDVYLILVMLVLPGEQAPRQELQRHWITASSFSSCQLHAEKLADKHRQVNEEVIKSSGAKVSARCYSQGTMK